MLGRRSSLSILGGGIAGLGVAYYAHQSGVPVTLFEAGDELGGNCRTVQRDGFRFDLGAHRFHDKDPGITADVRALLGGDLRHVNRPSAIYDRGRFVRFPLSAVDLLRHLGLRRSGRAALGLLKGRVRGRSLPPTNFESAAVTSYGREIADLFLLNYSAKLWGVKCDQLATSAGGGRLKGLTLRAALAETVLGRAAGTKHLDGSFYYPSRGIGGIAGALAGHSGDGLRTRAAVTRVYHDGRRIGAVEINGASRLAVERVVTTIPIDRFLQVLDPLPPTEMASAASSFRFRNLILVAFFLDRRSVTQHATVYFPDPSLQFTRAYEPRNRCELMAPPGKTSLVFEVPCDEGDTLWNATDDELAGSVRPRLAEIGWLSRERNPDSCVVRMRQAYPVSLAGNENRLRAVESYLARFENLRSIGRNACFEYTWMHVLLRRAKDLVDEWCNRS